MSQEKLLIETELLERKLTYKPSPTFVRFHSNSNIYRFIIGPFGSGKTSGCCMEIFTRCIQMPVCMDGIRRARWMVVRNTYPELETTAIKTWKEWFPEDRFGKFYNGYPAEHRMKFRAHDGVWCEFEIFFVALSNMSDFHKVLGFELTGIYFVEAREIDGDIVRGVHQRIGRYPTKQLPPRTPYFAGIIGCSNAPPEDSWMYRKIEIEKNPKWSFFWMPPAVIEVAPNTYEVNPGAENLNHLKEGYYQDNIQVMTQDEIDVYLLNKYGTVQSGTPCYTHFYRRTHVYEYSQEFDPEFPIYLGWDFGLTPCVVLGQYISGQLRILAEYQAFQTNLDDFLDIIFIPLWVSKYSHWSASGNYASIADPYGGGQRSQVDGQTCINRLNAAGIETDPMDFKLYGQQERFAAVNHFLRGMAFGRPSFQINPECTYSVRGFEGRYKFAQKTASGMTFTSEKVEDNDFTHSQDCVQTICLHVVNNVATMNSANKFQTQTIYSANPSPF